jgi:hypothetical protein
MDDQRREWLDHPLTRELLEKVKELRGDALTNLEQIAATGGGSPFGEAQDCIRQATAAYAYRVVAEGVLKGWS